ncbi:Maf family protein [Aestuariimicrobium sp. T2.26MG-19.2B]|uniref:Maf family protein n=1 Tax=Aestuariimicrobium sp. T2.26MG-19.2B TaxID=3040679 RepID=UPI0024777BE6|nr:Maf family protein [Aestuariimicrobium sp. T2.26MG-19.2B]CAI9407371.1 Nucleoside triphosphate pyrophosphatase [Aestuariimicrobium sp. T2.26MG-19.2B]
MRVILASKSPARLAALRSAGLDPEVWVSHADEDSLQRSTTQALTIALAELKGSVVAAELPDDEDWALIACDSLLELGGQRHGKPGNEAEAIARWYTMRGTTGVLWTGHHVIVHRAGPDGGVSLRASRGGQSRVTFADLSDAEIAAYAATGEPERVAGGFTIDGLGAAFVTRIEGDPHNVVGISLSLVRQMLLDLGVEWHTLWRLDR